MSGAGLYVLLLELPRSRRLVVGALGEVSFPAGRYLYTGSAQRGLELRVARHLRARKPLRWHVDYLSASRGCRRHGAALVMDEGSGLSECALNQLVRSAFSGELVAVGFGASDCRRRCLAHLWRTGAEPSMTSLVATLESGLVGRGRVARYGRTTRSGRDR